VRRRRSSSSRVMTVDEALDFMRSVRQVFERVKYQEFLVVLSQIDR
jgi:hypothetical protein